MFCQVLQIRRLCSYAGFADMHVLQIQRFRLSRVPVFVPASASAVTRDAGCEGVRRCPAVGVFNSTKEANRIKAGENSRKLKTRFVS